MTERFDYNKLTKEQIENLVKGTRTPLMDYTVAKKKANGNWCYTYVD